MESQNISLLFTTSRLLLELAGRIRGQFSEYGIRAICTGGTSCTPEEERYLKENRLQGVQWIDTYGNTLMGHALQGDPFEDHHHRSYHLPPPFSYVKVVNQEDWKTTVKNNSRGQVLLTTLFEDIFIPNLLERDSAIRVGKHQWFPWEGIAGIQPFNEAGADEFVEGVY